MSENNYKFGAVALIGKTNAGKSTLLNRIVGEKVSIVSKKAQTTRNNILGLYTGEEAQIAFVDTPGIHHGNSALSKYMNKSVSAAGAEVDAILYVLDGTKPFKETDIESINNYSAEHKVIVCVTKMDLTDKAELMKQMMKLNDAKCVSIVPVSAVKNKNMDELLKELIKILPVGEKMYEDDYLTDKSVSFMAAERIREKVLKLFDAEIPHGVMVIIREFKKDEEKDMYDITADIVCEKQNHKAIIIGKGGLALKRVAQNARLDLEKFLEKKVFLTVYVVVKEDWRESEKLIRQLGFDSRELEEK